MQAEVHSSLEWSSSARVLVSGDHPLIRTALGVLISGNGVKIAGECFNQPAALRRAVEAGVDLVLMDLDLDASWSTRTEKVEQLLAAANGSPVLIVTRGDDPKALISALQKGAAGVVLKTRPAEVLMRAVRAVLAGGVWLERSTAASLFRPAPMRGPVSDGAIVTARLTLREVQVVELVSLGLQNKKIAERLSITETTVRHHLTSIFDKLALTNRMELMRYAYSEGTRLPEPVGQS